MTKCDSAKFVSPAESTPASTSASTSADVPVREGEGEPRCRLGRRTHQDPEVGEGTRGMGGTGGTVGPAVEALKSEWDQAKQAAKKPPMSVQITAMQEFVKRGALDTIGRRYGRPKSLCWNDCSRWRQL